MSVQETRQSFIREIRKSTLKEMFAKRRRQILQQTNMNIEEVKKQINLIGDSLKQGNLNLNNLKRIKKVSEDQLGRIELKKTFLLQQILVYLQPQHLNSYEQLQVVWIYQNIFYLTNTHLPSEEFTSKIIQILRDCSQQSIIQHCLTIFNNILHDIKQFGHILQVKYDIIDLIWKFFNSEPNSAIVIQLLNLTFYITKDNPNKDFRLKKLLKFFLRIISTCTDNALVLTSICCLCNVSRILKQQCAQQIKNSRIINKLIELSKVYNNQRYNTKIIILISGNISSCPQQDVEKLLFPYFNQTIKQFPQLKINIYRIIYDILLQFNKIQVFFHNALFQQAYLDFDTDCTKEINKQFCYVFGLMIINLNQNDQYLKTYKKNIIQKMKEILIHSKDQALNIFIQNFFCTIKQQLA